MGPSRTLTRDVSGWSTLATTVRDVDTSKIKDQKEDIDTLLVFAGLFSAVMTSFLVQTYPELQQDPGDTTVFLLQQILLRMDGEASASSVDSQSTNPPFEVPPVMVFVNALWFSSLLFSLMTASIGMLVKQWLRDYLAVESTFPQAQLRIRHFRAPTLVTWKVYEIAAVLPLLLQLSLGLFFLGLCALTWSIHPVLGKASVPIVSLWAVFVTFTVIAPAFSARCPYKTPFLRSSMKVLRRWNYRMLRKLHVTLTRARHLGIKLVASAKLNFQRRRPAGLERDITSGSLNDPAWLIPSHPWKLGPIEEEDAALEDGHVKDIDIIVAVDALLSDDELLPTLLTDGAVESPHAIDWIRFLRRVIGNRLQREVLFDASRLPPDLAHLPQTTYDAIVRTTARILTRALNKLAAGEANGDPWIRQCLEQSFIVLLHSQANRLYPLPQLATETVQSFLDTNPVLAARFLGCAFFHLDNLPSMELFREVSAGLSLFLSQLDGRTAFARLKQIIAWRIYSAENTDIEFSPAVDQVSVPLHGSWRKAMDRETYKQLIWVVSRILKQEVEAVDRGSNKWSGWHTEILDSYIRMWQSMYVEFKRRSSPLIPTNSDEVNFAKLFVSQKSTGTFLNHLSSKEPLVMQFLLNHINRDMADYKPSVVSQNALRYIYSYLQSIECPAPSPKPMRLCFVMTQLSLVDPDVLDNLDLYRLSFTTIERLLHCAGTQGPREEEITLARQCLSRMHTAELKFSSEFQRRPSDATAQVTNSLPDSKRTTFGAWLASFDPSTSIYQDSLVLMLHKISGDANTDNFRVRRLSQLEGGRDNGCSLHQ